MEEVGVFCQRVAPEKGEPFEVVGGWAAVAEAIQADHLAWGGGVVIRPTVMGGEREFIAAYLVDGDTWLSRIVWRGITRRGGVPRPGQAKTLEDAVRALGLEPKDFDLESPWEVEESWEDAEGRERERRKG